VSGARWQVRHFDFCPSPLGKGERSTPAGGAAEARGGIGGGGGSACERGLSGVGRRGGVAERCRSRLGWGFPCLGRSPRTEAFAVGGQKRHCVRFVPSARALIGSGHEGGTPPTSPTSHVQFEPPRLARRPGNHRSPAAGRHGTALTRATGACPSARASATPSAAHAWGDPAER
jgi:hypothetical protein